ncbi:hypothetical protein [Thermomonas sp.]|uniref:hypothetical protein n=1 Tax=Thermomonas sp. TaxID=1971895 RepID=UPI00391BAF7B
MRTSRIIAVFVLASLVVFAAFLWQRLENQNERKSNEVEVDFPEPLHSLGFPLANKTKPSEWARRQAAREGVSDMETVVEAFRESGNCLQYFVAQHEMATINGDARNAGGASSDDMGISLRRYEAILDQTKDLCSGSDEETVARVYMASVLRAALQGDADAQSCFVISGSVIPSPKVMVSGRYTKYLESRYLAHVATFTQSALERGDPYVGRNAINRYLSSPATHDSMRDTLPLPDPYLTLRASYLASLIALPAQRASLEKSISTFEKLHILPNSEIISARKWAEDAFARNYSNAQKIDLGSFTPCHSLR